MRERAPLSSGIESFPGLRPIFSPNYDILHGRTPQRNFTMGPGARESSFPPSWLTILASPKRITQSRKRTRRMLQASNSMLAGQNDEEVLSSGSLFASSWLLTEVPAGPKPANNGFVGEGQAMLVNGCLPSLLYSLAKCLYFFYDPMGPSWVMSHISRASARLRSTLGFDAVGLRSARLISCLRCLLDYHSTDAVPSDQTRCIPRRHDAAEEEAHHP
jgi:hypothetical protein